MSAVVYALSKNGRPLYVGQSLCLENRLKAHVSKRFDGVWFQEVSPQDRLDIEAEVIAALRPPLNVRGNPDCAGEPRESFTFLMPAEHMRAIASIAKDENRTKGFVVREAIKLYLNRRPRR